MGGLGQVRHRHLRHRRCPGEAREEVDYGSILLRVVVLRACVRLGAALEIRWTRSLWTEVEDREPIRREQG
jgi:hypothetical protein